MTTTLSIDQPSILKLFEERNTKFLIPDYQRPYAWDKDECLTLWDDILSFASHDDFDQDEKYFLGSIVIFKNSDGDLEVIDGQQRLITILLILRAFYEIMKDFNYDDWCRDISKLICKCIWKTDEQGKPYLDELKLESKVATDNGEILRSILRDAVTKSDNEDKYSRNFRLFQAKISEFLEDLREKSSGSNFLKHFINLPNRILKNCMLISIKSEGQNSQDSALRIFSTLNDRGKPLSDSDIFKVQLYKAFLPNEKDWFIECWKELETLCEKMFTSLKNNLTPMDELFNRYMYYERSKQLNKDNTIEGLRAFYSKNSYELLRTEHERVFSNLIQLAKFWYSIHMQDDSRFSEKTLKRLFVLSYAPNAMWTLITSVYFIHNKDSEGYLDDEKFCSFLEKITAFIWAFTIYHNSSVHRLRTPIYKEMLNIVKDQEVTFADDKFSANNLKKAFEAYKFSGRTKITCSVLAWWFMSFKEQTLPDSAAAFEIEHIHRKGKTVNPSTYESIGNQSLLEAKTKSSISSTHSFSDKKKFYSGTTITRKPTQIFELQEISTTYSTFNVKDINQRSKKITEGFIAFVDQNSLII